MVRPLFERITGLFGAKPAPSCDRIASNFPLSAIALVLLGLALGCGGGGGTSAPPVVPPSNLVYPQTTIAATVGVPITPDVPTVTGTVTSYSISPTLPAGLNISSSTGTISGTPTASAAQASYTVTAANSAGSASASIMITVNPAVLPPSNLVYPQATIAATVGAPITPDVPTVTGSVTSYSISPVLPAGLNLDTSTGTISGTPTASAAIAVYTVTATNSGGSTAASISISVNSAPSVLLELGHSNQISFLRFDGYRVLSDDSNGHWVLWDYASGTNLANGDSVSVDMAGTTVVIDRGNSFEVRDYLDGHIVTTISPTATVAWWKLASDGSYICTGSPSGLSVWSASGQLLVSKAGDYSAAKSFAAPGEVRVALGPAGQQVVETISTTDGTSSVTPPFLGQFNTWFLDGARFLTNLSTTVWTYSQTGVQQSVIALPTIENLTGQGNWVWTASGAFPDYPLTIYPVNSGTPAAVFSLTVLTSVIPSSSTIGILPYGTGANSVIDLSGSMPSKVDYALPIAYTSAFGAASSNQWLVGNSHGAIVDGASLSNTTRYLGLGTAWSIAGGASRVAVATASGAITVMNPSVPTPEATINFSSSKLEMSSDASVLASMANANDAQYETDRTLKIFSLPIGGLISSWPYSFQYQDPFLFDFSLSGSGGTIGQVLGTSISGGFSYSRQAEAINGGSIIWSDTGSGSPILLSPSGTLIAVSTKPGDPTSVTNIFRNGTLVTAIAGSAVGWIDDGRLLVNSYLNVCTGRVCFIRYNGCSVYDPTGVQLSTPPLPELQQFQSVSSDWIYSPAKNAIYSVTSGAAVWVNADSSTVSAVSGPYVVYVVGTQVLTKTY